MGLLAGSHTLWATYRNRQSITLHRRYRGGVYSVCAGVYTSNRAVRCGVNRDACKAVIYTARNGLPRFAAIWALGLAPALVESIQL